MRYRFILEPYKGVSSRHICPNCHRKSCFARYIDTDEQIRFPHYVGCCNHEQKCGYNYTPKMYFAENPDARERLNDDYRPVVKPIKVEPPPPSFIEPKMMQLSMQHYEKNHLYQFLKTMLGKSAARELMQRYNVGSSKHWTGATVFWQVDISGRIRTGKVMLYNPENGRRIKYPHNHITWVHQLLKKEKCREIGGYLTKLEKEYEVITKNQPIFEKSSTKNVRYTIEDNFFTFWFRFIYKYNYMLEIENFDAVKTIINRDYETFSGKMLERYFKRVLMESKAYTRIGSWWDRKGENEIDIVAENELNDEAVFIEVKRKEDSFDAIVLNEKVDVFTRVTGKFKDYIVSQK